MSLARLKAVCCSHEAGKARYPPTAGNKAPDFAAWRENLTALSQYYNLFFVAQVNKIHVFRPQFPYQTTCGKLAFIIDLPVSPPPRPGYIDRLQPHAVNHLIIDDLGNEEVLLIACDDGDVIAYRTRSIADAIGQKPLEDSSPILPPEHFFLENVGYSAWGLAIHTKARLLAVSSNGHVIHVFVFALARPDKSRDKRPPIIDKRIDSYSEKYRLYWIGKVTEKVTKFSPIWKDAELPMVERSHINVVITLQAHETNIPNIAFYNSDHYDEDEESGVFLASIDIDGHLIIWDVWQCSPCLRIEFDWGNPRARGWSVAFIDRSTTQITQTAYDSFSLDTPHDGQTYFLNISPLTCTIPDNSSWHPAISNSPLPGTQTSATLTDPSELQEPEDVSGSDEEGSEESNPEGINGDTDMQMTEETSGIGVQAPEPGNLNSSDADVQMETHALLGTESGTHYTDNLQLALEDGEIPSIPYGSWHVIADEIQIDGETPEKAQTLPFNILMTSEKDIYLMSHMRAGRSTGGCMCRDAVHQVIPPSLPALKQIERLNMVHQIPELGVVAVANQAGRVALLTMTFWQPQRQPGFKIEAILPYMSQEQQGLRPECCLIGMAISPVQGHQSRPPYSEDDAPDSPPLHRVKGVRRFRLLMTYANHTILSYEISRPKGDVEILAI